MYRGATLEKLQSEFMCPRSGCHFIVLVVENIRCVIEWRMILCLQTLQLSCFYLSNLYLRPLLCFGPLALPIPVMLTCLSFTLNNSKISGCKSRG